LFLVFLFSSFPPSSVMFPSQLLLVAALAALHSFTLASEAPPPEITPGPTPTIDKRQVAGGTGTPILSTLHYAYTNLPYQVYPYQVLRGPQYGFNQCNSTTLGDSSNCQTLIFNGPVCFWPIASSSILTCYILGRFLSLGLSGCQGSHWEC